MKVAFFLLWLVSLSFGRTSDSRILRLTHGTLSSSLANPLSESSSATRSYISNTDMTSHRPISHGADKLSFPSHYLRLLGSSEDGSNGMLSKQGKLADEVSSESNSDFKSSSSFNRQNGNIMIKRSIKYELEDSQEVKKDFNSVIQTFKSTILRENDPGNRILPLDYASEYNETVVGNPYTYDNEREETSKLSKLQLSETTETSPQQVSDEKSESKSIFPSHSQSKDNIFPNEDIYNDNINKSFLERLYKHINTDPNIEIRSPQKSDHVSTQNSDVRFPSPGQRGNDESSLNQDFFARKNSAFVNSNKNRNSLTKITLNEGQNSTLSDNFTNYWFATEFYPPSNAPKRPRSSEAVFTNNQTEDNKISKTNETNKFRNVSSLFKDQFSSTSNKFISDIIHEYSLPQNRNSVNPALVIVLQNRSTDNTELYHKIISMLGNINENIKDKSQQLSLSASNHQFTEESSNTKRNHSERSRSRPTPYQGVLREFILNQIFLLSESLETLKEIEDKDSLERILSPKALGVALKDTLLTQNKRAKNGSTAFNREALNENRREKRAALNPAHFEAIDQFLSYQLLKQALNDEEDDDLSYLLEHLLSETKQHLQAVSLHYKIRIKDLPSKLATPPIDPHRISKLNQRKRLLEKIHLFNQLSRLSNISEAQQEDKAELLKKLELDTDDSSKSRRSRRSPKDELDTEEESQQNSGLSFTLPVIVVDDKTTNASLSGRSEEGKLKRLNLAYVTPHNVEASEEKLEKRMLPMEYFDSPELRTPARNLPELLSNSFVTQDRTKAEIEFKKRMLHVASSGESEKEAGNSTTPLNVLYEDTNILISEVPQNFRNNGRSNYTVEDLQSLLYNNGSIVSEVYIVKENRCSILRIIHDQYVEENCNFKNDAIVALNDSIYLSPEMKMSLINSEETTISDSSTPQIEPTSFRVPDTHLKDFHAPDHFINSETSGIHTTGDQYLLNSFSPENFQEINSELQSLYARMPEQDEDSSKMFEQQMMNSGITEEQLMDAYYFDPNNYNKLVNSIASNKLETAYTTNANTISNIDKLPFPTANKDYNTWAMEPKDKSDYHLKQSVKYDKPKNIENILAQNDGPEEGGKVSETAPDASRNDSDHIGASSTFSQRTERKTNDNGNILPNDLVNILQSLSNDHNALNSKDEELASNLNAGINILSNVELLLGQLGKIGQGQKPLPTDVAFRDADNESKNKSFSSSFNGLRVDTEKQINIELTLDNNDEKADDKASKEKSSEPQIKIQPSDLQKILSFRNTDFENKPKKTNSDKGDQKPLVDDKLFVLPASFLKNLDGFDYSQFESLVSANFSKDNSSERKPNETDEAFLRNLLHHKDTLINLLSNLNQSDDATAEKKLDADGLSHLKKLLKTKAEPVIDSIISTFFKPFMRSNPNDTETLMTKNRNNNARQNKNGSFSPENFEIFILRYDGGGGGVQSLLKEYKDFTNGLLKTSGRSLAAQVSNNTEVVSLNETATEGKNETTADGKVFFGTTTLNNGTNIRVTISINSNEKLLNTTDGGYYKDILLYENYDKSAGSKSTYGGYENQGGIYGRSEQSNSDSKSLHDVFNPILAANKPSNLKSNRNFGFIRLPRKTVSATETKGKVKNADFSVSLTNRKFSSRMQHLAPVEDYVSQLMPPLPGGKLIPHYQFPVVLPLESTKPKNPKWVWMKADGEEISQDSATEQRVIRTNVEALLDENYTESELSSNNAKAIVPLRNFFGESDLEDEEDFAAEESAPEAVRWSW